jgi:hypothetical protein
MSAPATLDIAEETPVTRAAVTGYVEARTQDRILGWAWDAANPEMRLAIGLVSAGRVVARTVADQPREDLARNGIGDGAHAFSFAIEPGMRDAAALEVVVLGSDGPLMRLPAAGEAGQPGLLQLQRGLATIAAGQRALLKAVRAPSPKTPELSEMVASLAAQQDRIEKAVGALEIFVTRLDNRLAALDAGRTEARPARAPLLLAGALALAGLAAITWAVAPALG